MPNELPASEPITRAAADALQQESARVPGTPPPLPSGIGFQPEQSFPKGKLFAGVLAAFVCIIAAGSAAGYFVLFRNDAPTPEAEIALMREAMKGVHAYAFETALTLDLKVKADSSAVMRGNSGIPTEGALKFTLTATGTANIGESPTTTQLDISYGMDGNVNYSAVSFIIDGSADLRVTDGKLYMRLVKIPQLLDMVGLQDSLEPWKGKWIVIGTSSVATLDPAIDNTLSGYSATTSQVYRDRAEAIVTKDWPFALTAPKEDAVKVYGVEVYHYRLTIIEKKLATLIADLSALTKEVYGEGGADMTNGNAALISRVFASTTGDLYIGKKNAYLYRTDIHIPLTVATSSYQVTGTADINIGAYHFNAISPILAPSDATAIEEVAKSVMGGKLGVSANMDERSISDQRINNPGVSDSLMVARMKSRDSQRISDTGLLQLALELFYDSHQKYPTSLDLLPKERFIPKLPLDPTDNDQYSYQQEKNGYSYALGASLERADNQVLTLDKDQQITGFRTSDAKGCKGESDRHCYDLSPE